MNGENRERDFHDQWALDTDPTEINVSDSWNALGAPEASWIENELGDVNGLRVLELGTGLGEGATQFARRGASVVATDISPEMLNVAHKVAALHHCTIETVVASATDLGKFAAESFDIVYGANVLHHVDTQRCLQEVHRVLKTGGRAAFWDPLNYNPVIKVYRSFAGEVRTEDEHPLRKSDIKQLRAIFSHVDTRFFWLTANLIFIRFFLFERISPSKGRYWKLVIERQHKHQRFLRTTHSLDKFLYKLCPVLQWWSWNIAVIAVKE